MSTITILLSIVVCLIIYMAFLFFKDWYPMWRQHRRDLKNVYPKAGKPNKKDIRKPEEKTLDFLLMPDELPNLEDRVVFDEHEKAIS